MRRFVFTPAFILFLTLSFFQTYAQVVSSESSISVKSERGVTRWKNSTGLTDFNIEFRGKIVVSDDDKDIKSISNDGYLEISKTVFGSKRSIIIESLGDGKMRKEYFEGRSKVAWDPAGKNWLAEILPDIVRSTTLGAEGRVDRFFNKGGASAVMDEIGDIKSDYVKAHYGKLLLAKNINNNEIPRVITGLGESIKSDYYLASLLKDNAGKLMATKDAADAFFKATQHISSDYYKAVVLKEALNKNAASPEQVKVVLQSASTINSDYYLSSVLTSLLEQNAVKDESLSELVIVSKKISSDHYRTQVLNKVLSKPGISKSISKNVVEALATISSDYYKSNVFSNLAEQAMDDETQLYIINLIDNSVNSDYYASVSLKKMLNNQKLSETAYNKLVVTASHISSDHYASEVLREAATKASTDSQLISICNATGNINSDHYVTTVLTAVAPQIRNGNSDVKEAYRKAAKKIRSETYYGRAMRAID